MSKKQKAKKSSPFWNPVKIGETLTAKFVRFETASSWEGMVLVLDGYKVTVGFVLRDLFSSCYKSLKVGSNIHITYQGKSKRTKLFTLEVNGKEIRPSQMFGEPANKKTLDGFFKTPLK